MENQITIKPTFDFKSIFEASLLIGLRSKFFLFFMIVVVLQVLNVFVNGINNFNSWIPLIVILIILPLLILVTLYVASKKQITGNPRIKENITYKLNNEYFFEKGETFEIKYFWKDIFMVEEKKDFFLIYIKNNIAKIIKKSDLNNNQYEEIKILFSGLNIKKNLK